MASLISSLKSGFFKLPMNNNHAVLIYASLSHYCKASSELRVASFSQGYKTEGYVLMIFIYQAGNVKNRIIWHCVKQHNHCKGDFTISLGMDDIQMAQEHNHDLNQLEVAAVKARADLKQHAGNPQEAPGGMVPVLATKLAELLADARPLLGKQEAVKKMIRRVRAGQHPIVPDSLQDLVADGEWAETAGPNRERFLIYDNGQDVDARILVFGSPTGVR